MNRSYLLNILLSNIKKFFKIKKFFQNKLLFCKQFINIAAKGSMVVSIFVKAQHFY